MIKILLSFLLLCPLLAFAQIDLQKPFDECKLKGSITIYDYKNKKWTFSDEKDAGRETLPASTFKIINSLIALETGVIKDENVVFEWDGKKRMVDSWNADTDLKNGFKNSTVWYFVELARLVGKEKYKTYLKQCNYGNDKIDSGEGEDFWNYGNFGVTPINQIEFMKNFYEENLPFSKRTFEIVKRIMIEETTEAHTLRSKTGWTHQDGKDVGWWVGYIEKKDNVYFFATRVSKDLDVQNERFSPCRKEITKKILEEMGILEIRR